MKADLLLSERQHIEAEFLRKLRVILVRRHFAVMEGQQQLAGGVFDHNLRVACLAKALLNRVPAAPAPVALHEPVLVPKVALPTVVITERIHPDNLRERLGLR